MKNRDPNNNIGHAALDNVYSLRQRYLTVTISVTLLLSCFAWLVQSYIGDYSRQHSAGLEMRTETAYDLYSLRNDLQRLEQSLNDYLWRPAKDKHRNLHREIDNTLSTFHRLKEQPWLRSSGNGEKLGDFGHDVEELESKLGQIFLQIDNEQEPLPSQDAEQFHRQLQPLLQHLWDYLHQLEREIRFHAGHDADELSHVAATTSHSIWLLVLAGLSLAGIGFVYFERGVLKPIAMVAHALKAEANGATLIELPRAHSRETQQLIDAFAEMRSQVLDRQQALERQALHDSLTGLPNRFGWQRALKEQCQKAGKEGSSLAVLLIGLDRFKEINDTLGHDTGDKVLQLFAERLKYLCPDSSFIARLGSDEFSIQLSDTGQEQAIHIARKILKEMEHPLQVDKLNLYISCSIGITLYPKNSGGPEALTRHADIAMYAAKRQKLGYALYERKYNTNSVHKLSLATDLREALQGKGLYLAFQPQLSLHTNSTSGLEVLLRWDHPNHGLVPPDEFIPIAEQTGLIHPLTTWLVDNTFEQMAAWRKKGLDTSLISLNISVFNLQSAEFLDMLKSRLNRWNIPPETIMLEITETAMMLDPTHARTTLSQLDALGVKLAVDDFGTGFSSLAYLKQLPVHKLKIDKSFVMEMDHNENDAVIVRSTIDMAHNLGLMVVAEGVESQEVRDLLEILDCDILQGYFISPPIQAVEAEKWLSPMNQGGKISHIMDYR